MAGTPTPNYQFPTYAETDTPNLAGAYNQAVNAIDAKIKEVADSVSSGGDVPDANSTTKGIAKLYDSATVGAGDQDDGGITPKAVKDYVDAHGGAAYTAGDGISIDGGTRITLRVAGNITSRNVDDIVTSGIPNTFKGGAWAMTTDGSTVDALAAVSDADKNFPNSTVITASALKSYVESKMVTAGAAYTGTAPIVVDNGSHTISVNVAGNASTSGESTIYGTPGTVRIAGNSQTLIGAAKDASGAGEHSAEAGKTVPNCYAIKDYIEQTIGSDRTANKDGATQQLSVDMLKNLWVNPTTGFVLYKAPTE